MTSILMCFSISSDDTITRTLPDNISNGILTYTLWFSISSSFCCLHKKKPCSLVTFRKISKRIISLQCAVALIAKRVGHSDTTYYKTRPRKLLVHFFFQITIHFVKWTKIIEFSQERTTQQPYLVNDSSQLDVEPGWLLA